ncbi:hypothetical protein [Sphingomonas sp. CFBP 8760]|uniref:hypothetical protein n=1 Tax=Sphingomonas sp. CFBP 8760 TaxID=2775282 RepID=UPI0017818ED5|nr:hypothetical protein [Sphingomonas sp. CFBP 8760]MBD8547159.1 hypothetical protein [Sphingomonas sp. CFBP 8760]
MFFKNIAVASAGFALVAAPVAASAAPVNAASTLSVAKSARAGSTTSKSSKLGAAGGASLIPLLIGAGIIAGATYLIVDHEDDDDADSN